MYGIRHSNIQGQREPKDLPLFNFEGPWKSGFQPEIWGYSSAGRAPALQAGGQRFDPAYLHQRFIGTEYPSGPQNGLIAQVVRAHA